MELASRLKTSTNWLSNNVSLADVRPRVLIAEDDQDLAMALSIRFGDVYDLSVRHTGGDFSRCFEVEAPDVMLVDYQLPDTNGIRLVESLWRRFGEEIPAIMISAYSNRRVASLDAGFQGFLHKPYEAQELVYEIERALNR